MAAPPAVLLISIEGGDLFSMVHDHFIKALYQKSRVLTATDMRTAVGMLKNSSIRSVLITDASISIKPAKIAVLPHLINFVKEGGTVVIGGQFSGFVSPLDVEPFWSLWGVPWSQGDYHRETFTLSRAAVFCQSEDVRKKELPVSVSMKAVYMKNVRKEDAVYTDFEYRTHEKQAPVIFAKVGEGRLGYVGDVNGEELLTPVILAMLGV